MKNNIKDIITIAKSPEVDARDIYPKLKKTIRKMINPNIPIAGVKNNTTPIEVAMAFPPANLR